jgi:hypothetical protein
MFAVSVGPIRSVGSTIVMTSARHHHRCGVATAFRAFSNTTAAMADQYDVVVVGTV